MSRRVAPLSSFVRSMPARALGGVAVVAAAALLSGCGGPADAQGGPPPAAPVSVAPAVERQVTDREEFSGRIEASEFVELRPRVAGTIERVHFVDGAAVRKGQLLFTIDPRPFQAEVARATSQAPPRARVPSWRRANWPALSNCSTPRRCRVRSSTS